jgi:hypothetical protein
MALTEEQQISVCQILDLMPYELTFQLDYMGSRLTAAMETDIGTNITLWNAGIGDKFTRLLPVESNKGVKTDPDSARANIRREIALLLERRDWASSGSGNYLPRG